LLTIAQLIGNLSRAGFGFTQIHWKPVGLFLLGAIPFSILGALSFVQLPKDLVTRAIGVAILVFVALRYFGLLKIKNGRALLVAGGGMVGFLSGLMGSAGPFGAAIFLSLGLPPVAYVASEATTALVMHGVKTVIYQHYIVLDREFWFLAVLMGAQWFSERGRPNGSLSECLAKHFGDLWPSCWWQSLVTWWFMDNSPVGRNKAV
jgi:uncharacterized membrane protein YfcA